MEKRSEMKPSWYMKINSKNEWIISDNGIIIKVKINIIYKIWSLIRNWIKNIT